MKTFFQLFSRRRKAKPVKTARLETDLKEARGTKSPSWVNSLLEANESYIKSLMGVYTFGDRN